MKTRRKLGRLIAVLAVAGTASAVGFGLAPVAGDPGTPESAFAGNGATLLPDAMEALARRGGGARGAPAGEATDPGEHDLAALRLLNRVILLVQEHYVDPEKVQPKEMLLGALDFIEKRIPEVLVDDRDARETGRVTLTVNRATQVFQIKEVNTVWDLSPRLREIFGFIQENLVSTEDTRQIEYAAINGMLSTLDPHSNLLDPEQYSDMKLHTRGEFGGVGFVVSMRDGRLTVMRVIPNTPAHKGGVMPRDVITRIEDESTVNMDLTEAVSRLRGKPGTPVNFWIERGEAEPRQITLVRDIIEIESIDPVRLLDDAVGYIRITNFQGHTTRDLRKAVAGLQEEAEDGLEGLILDLRGNPGGLLEQAIQVADLFVDRGTIVSTVGMNNRLRERKVASRSGTIADLPLVVLVSNTSASASEIVGGAVRNLDRGLVIGNPTFGKGSVQVLYDLVDDSALKLTIAQYLTPGDVSIQDLGIIPDIELTPALVAKNRVMVFAPRRSLRERDIEAMHGGAPDGGPAGPTPGLDPFRTTAPEDEGGKEPVSTLTFLRDDVPDDEEMDEFQEPEWKEDFHVRFAREVLAQAAAPTRRAMLERAESVIDGRRGDERRRIYDAISELGIDWTPAPEADGPRPQAQVEASLSFDGPSRAGEETHIALTLKNVGDAPLHRVRAWTESTSPRYVPYSMLFDRMEFLFGKLGPGESRTWNVPVTLPSDLVARREMVNVRVEADGAREPQAIPAVLEVDELPRPTFAFQWQIDDRSKGNGDGMLSVGEEAELSILVHNRGPGASEEAVVSIKNLEDQTVYISRGRHRIGELATGASGRAPMVLDLREGFEKDVVRLRVTIFDRKLAAFVSDDIEIPVAREAARTAEASGSIRLRADAPILAWAAPDARPVAQAKAGAVLPVEARVGDTFRVRYADDRIGFVAADTARALPRVRRAPSGEITPAYPHQAPQITVAGGAGTRTTDAGEFVLSGHAEDEDTLRDVYIFVNNDKVYFRAWQPPEPRESEDADDEAGTARLPFRTTIPLEEGANSVVIFARKNDELQSRRHLVIFRTPGALAKREAEEPATP